MKLLCIIIALRLFSIKDVLSAPNQGAPSFLESGKCASFSLVDNFQVDRYLGRWYYAWSVPSTYVKAHMCAVDTVTKIGKKMKVVTRGFTAGGSRARSQAKLNYIIPKSRKKAYMQLEATAVPAVPYIIMATDYTSYSCIYSCYNIIGLKAELYWIYSRTPQIPPEAQQRCFALFKSRGLDISRMVKNKHEGCNHPPINILPYLGNETDVTNVKGNDDVDYEGRINETYSDDEDDMEEGSGNIPQWSSSNLEAPHQHHQVNRGRLSTALEEAILGEEGKMFNEAFVNRRLDEQIVPEKNSSSDLKRESGNARKQVSGDPKNSSSSLLTSKSLLVTFVLVIIHFCPY